jgi:DNA polymerase-4
MTTRPRHIAHMHLYGELDEGRYAEVLDLLAGITPGVQAFPPHAVQLDLTSALRYFDLNPYDLVQMAKMRLPCRREGCAAAARGWAAGRPRRAA